MLTSSPSMDILISSNLERLVFELSNRDAELTRKRMEELKKTGLEYLRETQAIANQNSEKIWLEEETDLDLRPQTILDLQAKNPPQGKKYYFTLQR